MGSWEARAPFGGAVLRRAESNLWVADYPHPEPGIFPMLTQGAGRSVGGMATPVFPISVLGIRMGVLDRTTHLPTVVRAWNALADTAVRADGLLGWVQRIGHGPDSSQPVSATTTTDFAVGAFLLAAEQVAALM